MSRRQPHCPGGTEADARLDGHAILLSRFEQILNVGQAERSAKPACLRELSLHKVEQGSHAGVELRCRKRVLLALVTVVRHWTRCHLEEQLAHRRARRLRGPGHETVVYSTDALVLRVLHGAQPVAMELPVRGEGKAHRARMIASQLGRAHNLRQTARGNLRPPPRERADAANQRKHGLHALGRKEVLRLTVREGHILRNEIRNERLQDGMLG